MSCRRARNWRIVASSSVVMRLVSHPADDRADQLHREDDEEHDLEQRRGVPPDDLQCDVEDLAIPTGRRWGASVSTTSRYCPQA
jgi:hypothetical protein